MGVKRPIITFTTDFGTLDGYVGAVWGVILSICPQARILNLSHDIPAQDIAHAAFLLHNAARFYPKGTYHLAVVDPGVGTTRRGICVVTDGYVFIGPDNGIFTPFIKEDTEVYALENREFFREIVSNTFHGRDIFAPVTAHLARGLPPSDFGPRIKDPKLLPTWNNHLTDNGIEGAFVHIDRFGNSMTSFTPEDLDRFEEFNIWVPDNDEAPEGVALLRTYGEAGLGEPCWLVGSAGLIELAINGGDAAKRFSIERGDVVRIEGTLKNR